MQIFLTVIYKLVDSVGKSLLWGVYGLYFLFKKGFTALALSQLSSFPTYPRLFLSRVPFSNFQVYLIHLPACGFTCKMEIVFALNHRFRFLCNGPALLVSQTIGYFNFHFNLLEENNLGSQDGRAV